jgi:hypothetical protein
MIELRISKYDPGHRDSLGRYVPEDWTSVSDVGKCFSGLTLTVERYLQLEEGYLSCLRQMMALCEVHDVRCSDFEHHGVHEGIPQELRRVTSDDYGSLLHHGGSHFTPSEALSIARLVLREVVWCKMSGMRGISVTTTTCTWGEPPQMISLFRFPRASILSTALSRRTPEGHADFQFPSSYGRCL